MEPIIFITSDKMMKGGVLDTDDILVLKQASPDGKPIIMNPVEMLDAAEKEKPKQFKTMLEAEAKKHGMIRLNKEEFIKLSEMADGRFKAFEENFAVMPKYIAEMIRNWRVNDHLTWRAIARAAANQISFRLVFKPWNPPSNQLAGMALCNKAANVFEENYRLPPWN